MIKDVIATLGGFCLCILPILILINIWAENEILMKLILTDVVLIICLLIAQMIST